MATSPPIAQFIEEEETRLIRPKTGTFVFISHSTEDDEMVNRIRDALAAGGIDSWVDHINLVPGYNWDSMINGMRSGGKTGSVLRLESG
jgi:hypothetical protein